MPSSQIHPGRFHDLPCARPFFRFEEEIVLKPWHSGVCLPVLGLQWRASHEVLSGIMLSSHPFHAADMKHTRCTNMADCHTVLDVCGFGLLCSLPVDTCQLEHVSIDGSSTAN